MEMQKDLINDNLFPIWSSIFKKSYCNNDVAAQGAWAIDW